MLKINIITAYPEMFPGILNYSIIGKALKEKKWSLQIINLHEFGFDQRKSIDDVPFGGGPGMIIRADVVEKALNSININNNARSALLYMTPIGEQLNQSKVQKFSKLDEIIILCGRFEGVDSRAIEILGFQEISIGDYILSGGEVAAQVLVEGCIRLLPGVLGHPESALEESFSNSLLEYPHYTRPRIWVDAGKKEHHVPEILLSGNHDRIKKWRESKSFELTKKNRPDLLNKKKKKNE